MNADEIGEDVPLAISAQQFDKMVLVRIHRQHTRDISFKAKSGFALITSSYPALDGVKLILRGEDKTKDEIVVAHHAKTVLDAEKVLQYVLDAVVEYNEAQGHSGVRVEEELTLNKAVY